jgi:hypothetical protein
LSAKKEFKQATSAHRSPVSHACIKQTVSHTRVVELEMLGKIISMTTRTLLNGQCENTRGQGKTE